MNESQTQFASEGPLLNSYAVPKEPASQKDGKFPQPSKQRKIILIVSGVVGLGLLMLMTGLVLLARNNKEETVNEMTPTPTVTSQVRSEWQAELEELHADLEQADPTLVTVPFPPVDMEISLE